MEYSETAKISAIPMSVTLAAPVAGTLAGIIAIEAVRDESKVCVRLKVEGILRGANLPLGMDTIVSRLVRILLPTAETFARRLVKLTQREVSAPVGDNRAQNECEEAAAAAGPAAKLIPMSVTDWDPVAIKFDKGQELSSAVFQEKTLVRDPPLWNREAVTAIPRLSQSREAVE